MKVHLPSDDINIHKTCKRLSVNLLCDIDYRLNQILDMINDNCPSVSFISKDRISKLRDELQLLRIDIEYEVGKPKEEPKNAPNPEEVH